MHQLWNKCVFIATTRLCLNRFIYTPTHHHYDVTFFSDVIRRHVTFQAFFSDVIRHHHSLVCWEQNNIYTDVWKQKTFCSKQKTLCVENYTIFTKYQNCSWSPDLPLHTFQIFHGEPKLCSYCPFSSTIIYIIVFYLYDAPVRICQQIVWPILLYSQLTFVNIDGSDGKYMTLLKLFLGATKLGILKSEEMQ